VGQAGHIRQVDRHQVKGDAHIALQAHNGRPAVCQQAAVGAVALV
jgi:hypothetical protein